VARRRDRRRGGGRRPLQTEALAKYPDGVRAGAARSVPLGRLEEHAWLVALLASALGRRFSGTTVTIDGGRDNWFGPWPLPGLANEGGDVPTEARPAIPTA
jgi:citronellol/citronellal dehydrogenase